MSDEESGVISTFNVAEAKRRFSDLLGRVFYQGETVVIARRGRPVAKLVPVEEGRGKSCRLLQAKGWLEEDDPFLSAVDSAVAARRQHRPRVLSRRKKRK